MHKKLNTIQLFILVAFILSGCSALTSSQEEVIPPGVINTSKNITPMASPVKEDEFKGNINISAIDISKAVVYEGIEIELSGEYVDNCTSNNYNWKLEETNIIIEIGQKTEYAVECEQSSNPFYYAIPIQQTLDSNLEYTIIANGFKSKPFKIMNLPQSKNW